LLPHKAFDPHSAFEPQRALLPQRAFDPLIVVVGALELNSFDPQTAEFAQVDDVFQTDEGSSERYT
jgi:hypothetical protein